MVRTIKAYYDSVIACYQIVGLVMVALATTNNRWLRFFYSEMKRQIS